MSWNCPHCGALMKMGWQRDSYLCICYCPECNSAWLVNTTNGFDRAVLNEVPRTYVQEVS